MPQVGIPYGAAPTVPRAGTPHTVAPPVPQAGIPYSLAPTMPQAGVPHSVAPAMPQEGRHRGATGPDLDVKVDIASAAQVAVHAQEASKEWQA